MSGEQTMGLAYLLGAQLSQLPDEVAVEVGRAGLSGPYSEGIKARLESQEGPVIQELLKGEVE